MLTAGILSRIPPAAYALALAVAMFAWQHMKLVYARAALTTSESSLGACQQTAAKTLDTLDAQNQGIFNLVTQGQERQDRAEKAITEAKKKAYLAEQRAQEILSERTPDGVDACLAAGAAMDNELKQERGL